MRHLIFFSPSTSHRYIVFLPNLFGLVVNVDIAIASIHKFFLFGILKVKPFLEPNMQYLVSKCETTYFYIAWTKKNAIGGRFLFGIKLDFFVVGKSIFVLQHVPFFFLVLLQFSKLTSENSLRCVKKYYNCWLLPDVQAIKKNTASDL